MGGHGGPVIFLFWDNDICSLTGAHANRKQQSIPLLDSPPHLLRPPQLSLLSFGEPAAEPRSRSSNVMPETLAALAALTALGLARRALPALARHALLAMTALGDEKPWVAILVQT